MRVLEHLTPVGRPHTEATLAVMDFVAAAVAVGYAHHPEVEIPLPGPYFAEQLGIILATTSPAPRDAFEGCRVELGGTERPTIERQRDDAARPHDPHQVGGLVGFVEDAVDAELGGVTRVAEASSRVTVMAGLLVLQARVRRNARACAVNCLRREGLVKVCRTGGGRGAWDGGVRAFRLTATRPWGRPEHQGPSQRPGEQARVGVA